ncbi:MAG: phosphoglycerate kinase [Deltaproteobacteria bacterium RIFCSPLOWO2_02_FULL_50_16]|nr:MAG: phosphoglycerate kinase [Deltaproteobacteria bacterium GWA2_50_8]OGQ26769.1 MAG: phosphoglycerate kinase [Deltaproteobacteria bacterium RIFCSPHIGHO2_02_FULL_50_15]OGQ57050.1 MAG: phosphoglycerate kinase [Deltaproteobacteria bacterium RIFCSPLOWO2_02_FULL_50_16]OGQ66888.1 MAG: phosphoglycerate kinase [Deltaproteobacteria bacterium RIFCSPLOWO2_12_FULL_50_11]
MQYIDEINLAGKRVFIRVDFNVDRDKEGNITDDSRIRASLPTLQYALDRKSKVILASHLGRPKGQRDVQFSLVKVAERLSEILKKDVILPEDCIGDAVRKLAYDLKEGGVMLLENLRFHQEESDNEKAFSKELADLAEVYINDSFGTLHRAHASVSGMVNYFREKAAGFLVKNELEHLNRLLKNPERPFFAILGGAKVSDKIGVIENLLNKVQGLILGGGLAFTFLRVQGFSIGNSRFEEEKIFIAKKILEKARERNIPVFLPLDHAMAQSTDLGVAVRQSDGADVLEGWMGLDIGPKTIEKYQEVIRKAKTIFWNGPMGYFENPDFIKGSKAVAEAVIDSGATSIVGGGQSVSVLQQLGLSGKITHVSTGGGASLQYIEGKELPGLVALEN